MYYILVYIFGKKPRHLSQVVVYNVHKGLCKKNNKKIKFVSDLRQVSAFLRVLRYPPPIKLTAMI